MLEHLVRRFPIGPKHGIFHEIKSQLETFFPIQFVVFPLICALKRDKSAIFVRNETSRIVNLVLFVRNGSKQLGARFDTQVQNSHRQHSAKR